MDFDDIKVLPLHLQQEKKSASSQSDLAENKRGFFLVRRGGERGHPRPGEGGGAPNLSILGFFVSE